MIQCQHTKNHFNYTNNKCKMKYLKITIIITKTRSMVWFIFLKEWKTSTLAYTKHCETHDKKSI